MQDNIDKFANEILREASVSTSYSAEKSLMNFLDHESRLEYRKALNWLKSHALIEYVGNKQFKITTKGENVIKKGGIEQFNAFELNRVQRSERKEHFDFMHSKFKYYTFWPFFTLALFGGGYSAYSLIVDLSKEEADQLKQTPTTEMESELSKLRTLFLNHKNLDSLHTAKNPSDSAPTP